MLIYRLFNIYFLGGLLVAISCQHTHSSMVPQPIGAKVCYVTNQASEGWLDKANTQGGIGWPRDPLNPTMTIAVDICVDGVLNSMMDMSTNTNPSGQLAHTKSSTEELIGILLYLMFRYPHA